MNEIVKGDPRERTPNQLKYLGITKAGERLAELRAEGKQGEELRKALLKEIMYTASLYSDPTRQNEEDPGFQIDMAKKELYIGAAKEEGASEIQILYALAYNRLDHKKIPDTGGELVPSEEELRDALSRKGTTEADLRKALTPADKNLI